MSYPNRARSGVSLAAVFVFGFLASSVQADELSIRPGVEIFEEFSTNPTRARNRDLTDSAFAFRYKPNLELETRGQTGFNRLKLGVNGRQYHDSKFSNRDANDRFANFDFRRALSSRLAFFGSAGYYLNEDVDAILVESDGTVSPEGPIVLTSDRPDIETLSGQFGLDYALSPRSSLTLLGNLYSFDYDLPGQVTDSLDPFRNRRDFDSSIASLSYSRALTSRDTAVIQLSYRNTKFEAGADIEGVNFGFLAVRPLSPEQTDEQTAITLGWTRTWTPSLSTSISGGTRLLRSERDSYHAFAFLGQSQIIPLDGSPPRFVDNLLFVPGTDDDSTSFTGSASVTKELKRGTLQLFARQETRPSSGVSASVDETSYGFSYTHRVSSRLTASVGLRSEITEAANDNISDSARVKRYDASASWRIRQRWVGFVRATSTDSNADNRFFSSYSDRRVSFGFRYAFDLDELSPF